MNSQKRYSPTSSNSNYSKKPKINNFNNEDEHISNFDEDIEIEDIEFYNEPLPTSDEYDDIKFDSNWKRPPILDFNPSSQSLLFQQMDCDYTVGSPLSEQNSPNSSVPIIRFFGVTDESYSVCCHVYGFIPYFYCDCPQDFTTRDIQLFKVELETRLREMRGSVPDKCSCPIINIEIVQKNSLWNYHFNEKSLFLKVYTALPKLVSSCRTVLGRGIKINNSIKCLRTYESNLPFTLRFLVDNDIMGSSYIELPAGSYQLKSHLDNNNKRNTDVADITHLNQSKPPFGVYSQNLNPQYRNSYCQIEVNIFYQDIISHRPSGEYQRIAPLRILAFDIECAGRKGKFPEAEIDPVIQISSVITNHGGDHPLHKVVFALNSCAPIVGCQVISCSTEKDLLMSWHSFLISSDPDILTGYNIINFDLPYLINRCTALKLNSFHYLGRIQNEKSRIKDTVLTSRAYGTHENKEINICGRIQFDILPIIRKEYKLSSYTLNNVCSRFLDKCKEDVHHSIISELQNGNAETRRRLAEYCLKDSVLCQLLLDKLMLLVNHIEMARVTGVPFSYLLTRGQQIKVLSQLYRKAKQKNLIIPIRDRVISDEKYEGATVIEPKKGFYRDPISTLDFASLYPSIMMAHNLCYSTLVSRESMSRLSIDDYEKTPCGAVFVKGHIQKGVLPEILEELIQARKKCKEELKKCTEKSLQQKLRYKDCNILKLIDQVLNGRQLALKITANSVYGFTGAQVGQLPCLEISSSVTSYGRSMIELTRELVENKYNISNGYQHNATVIYGDTDSVMIKFGTPDLVDSIKLGQEAASYVSSHFPPPIKLEFEKVYYPYLLMNKKRYAGLMWNNSKAWTKLDAKGIETVRRDNCPLVRNMVENSLHKILMDSDPEAAVKYCKDIISDLLCNRIDISLLVITKSISKTEDDYKAKQAHVELADKMKKRDPLTAPGVGDRVAYVICQGAKGQPAYERAEDPLYVLDNYIPLDVNYYLEQQIKKPLERIFEPVLGSKISTLFTGDHTFSVKHTTSTQSQHGLMKFAIRKAKCSGCKCTLKDNEKGVCHNCQSMTPILYGRKLAEVNKQEKVFGQAWTQCQRCQESLHQDVLCTNNDCPIFYRRKKAQKDLTEALYQLNNF